MADPMMDSSSFFFSRNDDSVDILMNGCHMVFECFEACLFFVIVTCRRNRYGKHEKMIKNWDEKEGGVIRGGIGKLLD